MIGKLAACMLFGGFVALAQASHAGDRDTRSSALRSEAGDHVGFAQGNALSGLDVDSGLAAINRGLAMLGVAGLGPRGPAVVPGIGAVGVGPATYDDGFVIPAEPYDDHRDDHSLSTNGSAGDGREGMYLHPQRRFTYMDDDRPRGGGFVCSDYHGPVPGVRRVCRR